jgi:pimeloyl-ACP methyl ester carboxylesterase
VRRPPSSGKLKRLPLVVFMAILLGFGAVPASHALSGSSDRRSGLLARYSDQDGVDAGRKRKKPPAGRAVVSRAVTFAVRNTNSSALPCTSDGASYEVKGHLVAPRSALSTSKTRKRGVTLYLHGRGFGEFLWNFTAVPGQNYATAQAREGHASVVIDRIGYGASGHPDGSQSCLGSQADVAHQIIGKLRSGGYSVDRGTAVRFKRVALAGQSTGAQIANVEAYSFKDVDALMIVALSFQTTRRAVLAFGQTREICLRGGETSGPGGPAGYAYNFGQTAAEFRPTMFFDARKSVTEAVTTLRNRDPCGDTLSLVNALLRQQSALPKIKVPVLVICGKNDALFVRRGCSAQKDLYRGSRSASFAEVPKAGHAPMLERTSPNFRAKVSRWLKKRDL